MQEHRWISASVGNLVYSNEAVLEHTNLNKTIRSDNKIGSSLAPAYQARKLGHTSATAGATLTQTTFWEVGAIVTKSKSNPYLIRCRRTIRVRVLTIFEVLFAAVFGRSLIPVAASFVSVLTSGRHFIMFCSQHESVISWFQAILKRFHH